MVTLTRRYEDKVSSLSPDPDDRRLHNGRDDEVAMESIRMQIAKPTDDDDGAYRDRTDDLRLAKAALSQLS